MRKKIGFFKPKYNKINFQENPVNKDDETKWYSYNQKALKVGGKNTRIEINS